MGRASRDNRERHGDGVPAVQRVEGQAWPLLGAAIAKRSELEKLLQSHRLSVPRISHRSELRASQEFPVKQAPGLASPSEQEAFSVQHPLVAVERRTMVFSLVMFVSVWFSFVCDVLCRLPRSWCSVARKAHNSRVTSESGALSGARDPSSARRYSGWQTGTDVLLHDFRCHLVCVSVVSVRDTQCRLSRSWLSVACKADDARWSLPCWRTHLKGQVAGGPARR